MVSTGHGPWEVEDRQGRVFCVTLGRMLALSESRVFSHPMKDRRAKVGARCRQTDRQTGAIHIGEGFVVTFKGDRELKRNVPNVV